MTTMKISWPHAGNVIVGGFVCMVIAMSCLVYATTFHTPDMVSENYYENELHHDDNMTARANAAALLFPTEVNENEVNIQLPLELVEELQIGKILFYCQSDGAQDKTIPLIKGQQSYQVPTTGWLPREYRIMISSKTFEKSFYKEFVIQIK